MGILNCKDKLLRIYCFIFTLAMLVNFSGCMVYTPADTENSSGSSSSAAGSPTSSTASVSESTPVSSVPGGIGDTISSDTWNITLLYAKTLDQIGSEFMVETPEEGKEFLVLFFDVENVSDKDDYFNILNFESYTDSYSTVTSATINNIDGLRTLTGNVGSGKKIKGYITYQVDAGWQEFETTYTGGLGSSEKYATFVLSPEDLSDPDYLYDFPKETIQVDAAAISQIGSIIENDQWNITLLDVKEFPTVGDQYLSQSASEGNTFLIVFLEAENVSSEDDFFNPLYVSSYLDNYNTVSTTLMQSVDGLPTISGDVAAGKKIKGYLAWEVPEDWQALEIIYDDGVFVSNKLAELLITPDLVSNK